MIETIKKIFGIGPKINLGNVINEGATIIDVRTVEEYKGGHLKNSINIPLNVLGSQLSKIKKDKPVITVCASGMRSGAARTTLLAQGYTNVYNGGSWFNLKQYEK